MRYLLCHGFGFTDDYWKNFVPLLNYEYEFWHKNFRPKEGKSYIGIGHSIGFLKLNNSGIKFKALIGLQGFLNFCGNNQIRKNIREKNLNRMIEFCSETPEDFLRFFYKSCDYHENIPPDISKDELISELNIMKFSYPHCKVPTLIIGSHSDKIVETSILEDNFNCNKLIRLKYIDNVSHNLGYSKSKEAVDMIIDFLEDIL